MGIPRARCGRRTIPIFYAILAWQLANAGIASVRYDKRVLGDNLQKVDLPSITNRRFHR